MTAYAVARRTQEIGIRMVFGAQAGQVVGSVVRDTLLPVTLGIVVGLIGAGLSTRAIQSFLFETEPIDIPTFAGVALVLLLTGCFAAWLPARRATRIDPVVALRE
jgi:ABC-type antimicrobial peptide transport system permease subunit